jgi:hypothetical protein
LPDISKINALAIGSVSKVDGLAKASILDIDGVSVPSAFTGLLDETYGSGSAAAYSVRQLKSGVTVAMRVRRDTAGGTGDDDEADVSFDTSFTNPTISLDSALTNKSAGVTATTLGEFLNVGTVGGTTYSNPDSLSGTASCYLDEWKDQSGNANHAEQTAFGSQPQIHNGTVNTDLITENGKPGVEFTSFDNLTFSSTDIYSFFIVSRPTTLNTNSTNVAVGLSTAIKGVVVAGDASSRQARAQTNTGTLNITGIGVSTAQSLVDYVTTGTTGKIRYNGANEVTGSATQITVDQIGTADTANFRVLNGPLQEIIMWPTDQDSNRSAITTDINDYFSIY